VDWNCYVESRLSPMEQSRVTSLLVVDVKARAQERGDYLLGPKDRELWGHAERRLRNGYCDPFCGHFGKVSGDWLPRQDDAFQITPDRVSRHFARFFQGRTESADLRNRRHEHAEPAFR
jgi:hypothetical protein